MSANVGILEPDPRPIELAASGVAALLSVFLSAVAGEDGRLLRRGCRSRQVLQPYCQDWDAEFKIGDRHRKSRRPPKQ